VHQLVPRPVVRLLVAGLLWRSFPGCLIPCLAGWLACWLADVSCRALHGDIAQAQREATLAGFRTGKFSVLVATDVAARGLDISGVELVIQVSRWVNAGGAPALPEMTRHATLSCWHDSC